jgi:hypothetical protein
MEVKIANLLSLPAELCRELQIIDRRGLSCIKEFKVQWEMKPKNSVHGGKCSAPGGE